MTKTTENKQKRKKQVDGRNVKQGNSYPNAQDWSQPPVW